MPDDITIFNHCAVLILNKLNRNFPKDEDLMISDFKEFDSEAKSPIFSDTARFLEHEGYIKFQSIVYGGFLGAVLTSKGLHINIKQILILTEIKEGKKSFEPTSNSQSDMEDFQSVAKILLHAHQQGWLNSFKPHRKRRTRNQWYDLILVQSGLSNEGEQYLQNIFSEGMAISKTQEDITDLKTPLPNTQVIKGDVIMGDKYCAGQVGAQGPNAHAHDINFNQLWNQHCEEIKLDSLVEELKTLRNNLRKEAETPEQDLVVAAIAKAEIEANKGNGSKVIEWLSKVGNWALDTATQIGIKLAAEAISIAMGIKK